MLVDPRNGPAFDLPPGPPGRLYVVASTPRSGSTLLCRTLWATGRVGAPKEILNPPALRDWEVRLGSPASRLAHGALRGPGVGLAGRGRWGDARLRAHLDRVRARRTGGGWFGLKLHHHHARRFFVDAGRDLHAWLPAAVWIRVRRRDRLAQAVSWVRARQTGRWAAHRRGWRPARYSRAAIDRALDALDAAEADWSAWLAGHLVHEVVYEDLVDDFEGTVRGVLEALDAGDAPVPAPPLARQADAASARWIARYRAGR